MTILPSTLEPALFRRRLLRWFDANRRDLPWRRTRDPYAIWVAEIMLQQTRVAAVLEHYREFLRRFPSVAALARARSAAVLAAWSGLGYYRRARALHAAARLIVSEHAGQIPDDAAALARLPGIGRYTSAALASTAFGRRCAVVDGNVERVLTRLLGDTAPRQQIWQVAESLLSRRRPGDFNQAMMELGATICTPKAPQCDACPLRPWCSTRGPLPHARKEYRRKRRVSYLLAVANGRVWLAQRDRNSPQMAGMWELPQIGVAGACRPRARPCPTLAVDAMHLRHSITNTDYEVTVIPGEPPEEESGCWIRVARLQQLPLTGLARKVLRRAGII